MVSFCHLLYQIAKLFDGFLKELNVVQFTSFFFFFSFHTKGVLKRRDQIQGELDSKVDALANKKTEKDLVSIFKKPDFQVLL